MLVAAAATDYSPAWSAPPDGAEAAKRLFREHCQRCHGADGTGRQQEAPAGIPNFTHSDWQGQRSDTELRVSILDGKGKGMPSFQNRLSEVQAKSLVAHVRAFASNRSPTPSTRPAVGSDGGDFEREYQRLQADLDDLKKRQKELDSTPRPPVKPSTEVAKGPAEAPRAEDTAPAAKTLYQKHCQRCHGEDGTGKQRTARKNVPDFSRRDWQERRSDAQLLQSILEGKGSKMPPWREKLSEDQARSLVVYIRTFASSPGMTEDEEQSGPPSSGPPSSDPPSSDPPSSDPAEDNPPRGFFEKLIGWLGKFHPAAIHFPIALLAAAAVAELLRMVTGQPAFEAVVRYCLWFGTLTALVAGPLGWFLGGIHLTDASWVMMTHRWLGTATVAWAGLALLLSEVGRRTNGQRTRTGLRVMLLVAASLALATGFFGGAVVYGLDHYAWPP
jgi:mono/diheme cytochrome c family protein/uncharacterized membrane protein